MADQRLDVFDGEDEEERLWEALSSFKEMVRDLVEMTGLSTNVLADTYGFGKGKVSTWQTAKPEQPNIPPLRFVEVLIKEAQERANLQDGAAAVFLHQYGELLQLYCARANPHNVHRQMLLDYRNTLLIRELNEAASAALEKMAGLTGELEALRGDRDGERRRRIALQQQIDSLRSQNQDRAAEKRTALARRDQIRADLTAYEKDQQLEKWQPGAEQGGSHTNHPHEPAFVLSAPPPSGRGTKRRGLVLALVAAGAVVVSLAVYAGTQLSGDRNDHKDTTSSGPGTTPTASTDGPASPGRPTGDTTSAGTPAVPPVAGGGPAHGGSSSSGGVDGGSSSNGTTGGSSGGASGGNTTGGKSGGGSGDGGGSGGSKGSSGSGGASGATSPKPPAPGGDFRLRDVGYGQCLAASYLNVVFATCADSPVADWTAKAGSGGSYMLYNESAGQCLTVYTNQMYLAECGSKSGQSWRTGTSSTVVNLYSGLCLDESSGWPVLASCEPSRSTQHWARE
ncbi:ricin-type beta-trefoil lectin domain protein [Streptomyces sp. NPDC056178]|uniref:RICIN domain-containing protein n=1 Tax=Streptomyces sp. NPDC056178 TaxID=3345735 RepID=UPI0035E0F0E9